jgi:hypothetical protein
MSKTKNGIRGFKGFDKDLKCKDHQYEVGKSYETEKAKACETGFHFCENPFDVLSYYFPGDKNRYGTVIGSGETDRHDKDSKIACTNIHIEAEIGFKDLIVSGMKFIFSLVKASKISSATTGNYAHSATTGNYAHSATTGYSAHSATTGDSAHSATTGYYAHSATTGDYAHSATTGNSAHSATTGYSAHSATTGYSAHSATTGYSAHSATTGDYAHSEVKGENAIACSLGREGQASGVTGSWLVLSEYGDKGELLTVKTVQVDGKTIQADTWYSLKGGEFVVVKA